MFISKFLLCLNHKCQKMSIQKQSISMPQANQHNKNSLSNNICCKGRTLTVSSPTFRILHITNFLNFQIIHSSNQSISQRNENKSIKPSVYTRPENSCFPNKSICRGLSSETNKQNGPSKSGSCRTLILTLQIP